MHRLLLVASLAVVSCGGRHTAPAHRHDDDRHDLAPFGAAAPDEAECDALIAHAVALGMTDQRATRPAERVPTEDQQAQTKVALRVKYDPSCRSMSRSGYECAVDAPTIDALAACDQASFKSSTSNSRVAPPGITPPAPRSP